MTNRMARIHDTEDLSSNEDPEGVDYFSDSEIDALQAADSLTLKDGEHDLQNRPSPRRSKSVDFSGTMEVHEVSRYKRASKSKYHKLTTLQKVSLKNITFLKKSLRLP